MTQKSQPFNLSSLTLNQLRDPKIKETRPLKDLMKHKRLITITFSLKPS